MKKFLLSLACLFCIITAGATEATITFSQQGYTNAQEVVEVNVDNFIKLTFDKGTNSNTPKYYNTGQAMRVYGGGTMTVSGIGVVITNVKMNTGSGDYVVNSASTVSAGTLTVNGSTATISDVNAPEVVFTQGGTKGHVRIVSMTIEYVAGDTNTVFPPTISPKSGEYVEGDKAEVTIEAADGLDIYYALNSDDLEHDAEEYTGETIEITSNTTVYAWASDGEQTSEAATATFNFTAPLGNIAAFNALEKGKAAKFISPLTAVYQNGSNLVVKDDSGTMLIYGNVGQTYNNGDVIAAGTRGYVSEYGGNKQLSPTADSFTAGVAGTAVTPVKKTVAELASCTFLEYVKLEGVYFTLDEGKTKNYTVSDGTNSFAAYNQFNITIEGLAEGVTYNVEGFVSSYNGKAQLQPINVKVADASGITGVSSLNEKFDSTLPTTWTSVAVSGDVNWYAGSYNNNYYAAMSAYKATVVPVEAWFISPALNVKDAELKTVSFKTQVNGYGATDTQFKVYVLDGTDVATANKTELNATLAVAPESGYSEWVESGEIDLSTYGDVVYVAFYYSAPASASAAWCVDDVKFNVKEEEKPEGLGTKEAPITVAEAKAAYVDGEKKAAWVTGYIVGCLEGSVSKALFGLPTDTNTNLIIADAADCTDVNLCIPVELPKGTVRTGLNLVDNKTNLGKKVTLKCSIEKYFSIAGLKGTSEYVLENSSAIEEIGTDVNAPVEYYNLQGVKVANPENGIFIKKQGSRTTKVVL